MLAAGLALVRDDVAPGGRVRRRRRPAAGRRRRRPRWSSPIDLRRYERWVVEHVARAAAAGATVVAVTDSPLSPARRAGRGGVHRGRRGRRPVRQPRRHPRPGQRPGDRASPPGCGAAPPTASTRSRPPGGPPGALVERLSADRPAGRGPTGADRSRSSPPDGDGRVRGGDGARAVGHGGDGRPPGVVGRAWRSCGPGAARPTPPWPPARCWPSPTSTSAGWAATCSPSSTCPASRRSTRCAAPGGPGSGADALQARVEGLDRLPSTGDIRAVTVPGCVDGWLELHRRHGRLPLDQVLEAGDHLRRHRLPGVAACWRLMAPAGPRARRRRRLPRARDGRRRPAARRARCSAGPASPRRSRRSPPQGRAGFYLGPFGEGLLRLGGGVFTRDDLARRQAEWVEPRARSTSGATPCTRPPRRRRAT